MEEGTPTAPLDTGTVVNAGHNTTDGDDFHDDGDDDHDDDDECV